MEKIKLYCEYCNVEIEYFGKKDFFLKSMWDDEHRMCKDFRYVQSIKIKGKGGKKLWAY